MRVSKLASRTLREASSGGGSKGHEFLLRAGYVRQLAAGIFTNMPLGFRSLKKIEQIIREEMDRIGGQEIAMPVVNPADIWKTTGRWYAIDSEMGRFMDRNDRDMVLAMTHEEAVSDVMSKELVSYKQLPILLYQIQTKWRDDPRPRAGLIRVREFVMKDSYSFDKDFEGLELQYKEHFKAYFRIFGRCGLPVIAVGSDSGMMGGKIAHEYMYLSPVGEDTIIYCDSCDYSANRQVAAFKKDYFKEEPLELQEVETPNAATIEELCVFLGIEHRQTAKMVFMMGTYSDGEEKTEKLIAAVIRGDLEVEEAKLQNAAKADKLRPAQDVEIRDAGMEPGYAGLIGIEDVIVIVDDSVAESSNLVCGANKKGFHVKNSNFGRDYSGTVTDIASAAEGYICAECGAELKSSRGVEVGNIFQLGTRYSESMGMKYQDENGKEQLAVMGSYGIGVGRLLACASEEFHDDAGLKLPISIAPYQVHLISLMKTGSEPEELYTKLQDAGVEVLYDDRKDSPGVKFADADLLGIPIRLTIGKRSLEAGGVELQLRDGGEKEIIALDGLIEKIQKLITDMYDDLEKNMTIKELS
jgi:prolyl-tRNA synthetase